MRSQIIDEIQQILAQDLIDTARRSPLITARTADDPDGVGWVCSIMDHELDAETDIAALQPFLLACTVLARVLSERTFRAAAKLAKKKYVYLSVHDAPEGGPMTAREAVRFLTRTITGGEKPMLNSEEALSITQSLTQELIAPYRGVDALDNLPLSQWNAFQVAREILTDPAFANGVRMELRYGLLEQRTEVSSMSPGAQSNTTADETPGSPRGEVESLLADFHMPIIDRGGVRTLSPMQQEALAKVSRLNARLRDQAFAQPVKYGWHFLPDDKRLSHGDNRKVRRGVRLAVEGELVCGKKGLHGATRIIDALHHASSPIISWCEFGGGFTHGLDSFCARWRKPLWIANITPLLREFVYEEERRVAGEPPQPCPDSVKRQRRLKGKELVNRAWHAAWESAFHCGPDTNDPDTSTIWHEVLTEQNERLASRVRRLMVDDGIALS